tara:strand:+ start:537 stop:854 length:318 start_codon:yes stop_codon:yes gene_type:complete
VGRKKSWRSGEIKSTQTFSYQSSTNFNINDTISINEVDTARTQVQHFSVQDTGSAIGEYSNDMALRTRIYYLNTSTQLVGQTRNSTGSTASCASAGAGQVTEFYA